MPDEKRAAFADYVRAQGERQVRLAWLITRNWEDARDAVQEAFTSLLPRWARLPLGVKLESYVSRSVVNASLTLVKRRSRTTPVSDPAELMGGATPDSFDEVIDADLLWRLCSELSPIQRAALALRFYRDLTFADIAVILGCTESTARSHVRRAVVALRRRVAEEAM